MSEKVPLVLQEEINEIPFFDHELPRELALKIFQHLDIKDLCNCSQVSTASMLIIHTRGTCNLINSLWPGSMMTSEA